MAAGGQNGTVKMYDLQAARGAWPASNVGRCQTIQSSVIGGSALRCHAGRLASSDRLWLLCAYAPLALQ